MPKFIVTSGVVLLGIGSIQPTDVMLDGILRSATGGLNRAVSAGFDVWCNGVHETNAGQIRYVDATASLPANTVWVNGLPYSGAGLCVSTNPASTYSNGLPFAANGALAVGLIP